MSRPDTYPYLLEQSLRRRHPQRRLEVFNLGVLAYSSLQVEELLRARAWDLRPDHIVVGVAMNDASVAKYHDRDLVGKAGAVSRPARRQPWTSWLRFSQLARLATYIGEIRRFEPLTPGEHLVEAADPGQGTPYLIPGASGMLDYGRLAGRSRVSLPEYEQSLRRIVEAARGAGVGSTLLYNDLAPNSPYLTVLQRLSRELRVPLVNAQALVSRAREKMEQDLEAELALRPDAGVGPAEGSRVASAKEVGVTFRVYVPSRPVGDAIYIAAAHADLGNAVPNVVRLYDDGSHGDQRAHDRVWSYRTTLAPGTRIFYMYTNSGRPKRWEGLDVPDIRAFVVPEVGGVRESYRPIDTFGQVYMQADSWHTNGLGYALIAEAVSDVLSEALSGNGIAAQARGPHGPRD